MEFGPKSANLLLCLDINWALFCMGLNYSLPFTSSISILPYYGPIELNSSSVGRRAEPNRASFFCLDIG